jgi:hypothetical protein
MLFPRQETIYLPSSFCADRAVPKSREGWLRRDGVVVMVNDVLTADHDSSSSTCGVEAAAANAGACAAKVRDVVGGVVDRA